MKIQERVIKVYCKDVHSKINSSKQTKISKDNIVAYEDNIISNTQLYIFNYQLNKNIFVSIL